MSVEILMPQMGESVAEGTIVRWIKHVGDVIDKDEPLFEISTDKVDAEIPSPGAGILVEIRVKEGDTVLFTAWAGDEFKQKASKDVILVMHEEDVLAVVEK